jgi:predicted porin
MVDHSVLPRAAAVALAFPLLANGSAIAQSSLVIYGRVAGGIDYVSGIAAGSVGGGGALHYGSNQWRPSLWGFMGTEDLGGGLSAVMHLESGFSSGNGNVLDVLFTRFSVAGLSSKQYGTLVLGRAMSLPDSEGWEVDPLALQITSAATLQENRGWGPRPSLISYDSPLAGPWSLRVQARLKGTSASAPESRLLAGCVTYRSDPLLVKVIYEEIRDPAGQFSNLYSASRLYSAGVVYAIGDLKLYAGNSLIRSGAATVADAANPMAATRQHMYWLGANYQATPALILLGGAYRALRNRGGNGTLIALGATYNFSPTTLLYATAAAVANDGNAAFSTETSGRRPAAGAGQKSLYAGLVQGF